MTGVDPIREARLLEKQGRFGEAVECYARGVARSPQWANGWYNLALLQRKARLFRAALDSYRKALDLGVAQPEEGHVNRAVIFADDLRDHEAAERELEAALSLNPSYVPALINLANLYEDLGRRAAALATYERILALDPVCWTALARYAGLCGRSEAGDAVIERLRQGMAAPGVSASDRATLGFALGGALDARGDYPGAFAAYSLANRLSRESVPGALAHYDRSAHERLIDRVIAAFPPDRPGLARRAPHPRPIFVCGMFRSGSTLIEQLLAGHPRIVAGGELDIVPHIARERLAPFPEGAASAPPGRIEELREQYLRSLAGLFPGSEHVIDKRPDNFLNIGLIKRLFPEAKIVHTVRNALDNCLSVFFLHLDQRMSYALDLMDIGHYYREYRRLMAHWKSLWSDDIFDVDYDSLVRDPRGTMEPLLGFLGLEWDERCLAANRSDRVIKTASVWQAREPLYQSSSGRSRHYASQLSALASYLG